MITNCSKSYPSIPQQSFTQRRKKSRSAVGLACRHNPAVVAAASAVTLALHSATASLQILTLTLHLLSFCWAGKQRSTSNKIFLALRIMSFAPFLHAVPRALKTIVSRWISLEDDDNSEEEEEEEGNSENEGGENFSVNEVFELF